MGEIARVAGFIHVQRRGAATILSALHRTRNCAYLRPNRPGAVIAAPPQLADRVAKCQLCFDREALTKKKLRRSGVVYDFTEAPK
jgi:hypothetical protein